MMRERLKNMSHVWATCWISGGLTSANGDGEEAEHDVQEKLQLKDNYFVVIYTKLLRQDSDLL
jgi:hypothetical protein